MSTPQLNEGQGNSAVIVIVLLISKRCALPGGATILCHFWKRQVFRQSLGLKL